jgi:UDP-N-acetyl-D-galactosamine dehydrogenase
MARFVAGRIAERLPGSAAILVLGLSFKENVPDLRNSKVVDLIGALAAAGHRVRVHDPLADPAEAARVYGLDLETAWPPAGRFDAVVGAVAHDLYRGLGAAELAALIAPEGLLADPKGIWRGLALPPGLRRWTL